MKYKDGYWQHDFTDIPSSLDREDFICLIDTEDENNEYGVGRWCIEERVEEKVTGKNTYKLAIYCFFLSADFSKCLAIPPSKHPWPIDYI